MDDQTTLPPRRYTAAACGRLINKTAGTIRRLSRMGKFPQPIGLTERGNEWVADEVDAWIAARVAARQPWPIAATPEMRAA